MCKILELFDKNLWRNDQSKLSTFDPILQRPHSAYQLYMLLRCKAMSYPEKQAREAWASTGEKEEEGNEEEKEPAIVDRV